LVWILDAEIDPIRNAKDVEVSLETGNFHPPHQHQSWIVHLFLFQLGGSGIVIGDGQEIHPPCPGLEDQFCRAEGAVAVPGVAVELASQPLCLLFFRPVMLRRRSWQPKRSCGSEAGLACGVNAGLGSDGYFNVVGAALRPNFVQS